MNDASKPPRTSRPAAATPQAVPDRGALALVAFERTRVPMIATDPRQPDNPIVLANHAFLEVTGYSADEVLGRNCRFLQGPETAPEAVARIRDALAAATDVEAELLNYRKDGSTFWNRLFISPVRDDDGRLLYFYASQKDVTAEREARRSQAAELRLLREVDHRAKNVLALVQGIVRMSRADSVEAYARAVQGRVQALARAHALLSEHRWHELPLDKLIAAEVEPFETDALTTAGPPVVLPSRLVQPIALVVYELVMNAAQHGALSRPEGRAHISWREDPPGDRLIIGWHETGGAEPAATRPSGFGLTIMRSIIERQLRGSLELDWRREGLAGRLDVPLHSRTPGRAA